MIMITSDLAPLNESNLGGKTKCENKMRKIGCYGNDSLATSRFLVQIRDFLPLDNLMSCEKYLKMFRDVMYEYNA